MNYRIADSISQDHILLKNYSPTISQLLVNRDINDVQEAEQFINPDFLKNYDPFLLDGMDIFVERIHTTIKNDEKITVYADYDADGIPGAVVIHSLFEKINYNNYDIYIPHRHDEGYGLHREALEKIAESGTDLLITIDLGITATKEAEYAKELGMELIITDHHLPVFKDKVEQLPEAIAIINPKKSACSYPDNMLCGAGVMFKCVQAFLMKHREEFKIHEGWEKWLLDMVGIATISDMVPLLNENRMFAYFGMQVIKKTKRIGLKKLLWNVGISVNHMTEEDIAFSISPKINAASRMSHPEDALALFLKTDEAEAEAAMKHLVSLNNERKKLVAKTMKTAKSKLKDRTIGSVLVIGSTDWQAGILGLVAGKLADEYQVPTFVWSEEKGVIKGSCRSAQGIHLVDLMSAAEEKSFNQFGGHAEAGGFSCEKNEIHFLQERLESSLSKLPKNTEYKDEQIIDHELSLDGVTNEFYKEFQQLAPFGMANPKPVFIFKDITAHELKTFGKHGEHIEVHFKNNFGKNIRAIAFFKKAEDFAITPKINIPSNLVANIEYSVFMGKHELRLRIVDFIK